MGKVILVTGCSRGIGRSVAEVILNTSQDAVVYGIARSEAPLEELKHKYGDRFFYVAGDVTDRAVLSKLVDNAIQDQGRIDSVVANAGVIEPIQNVRDIDVDQWKKLFDINYFSIVYLVSITIKHLEKTQGNIVFVSSDASDTYFECLGAYGSSKAALNHFATTVARDQNSVKALSIAPGIVDTDMQGVLRGNNAMPEEALKSFESLKSEKKLEDSSISATVYANLALNGIPEEVNGKYLSYNDESLKAFQS